MDITTLKPADLKGVGLEKIVRIGDNRATLPSVAIPSAVGSAKALPSPITKAVAPPNLADLLEDNFLPPLKDATVLLPMNFKRVMTQTTDALIENARGANSHSQTKLLDAADVLTRLHTDLAELDQRRSALLRG